MIRNNATTPVTAVLALVLAVCAPRGAYALPEPFDIHYERCDTHVMLYFTGHPEYEAIEAFVSGQQGNKIRVTITAHDQTQTDYLNDERAVSARRSSGLSRETRFANVSYEKSVKRGKPEVSLGFTTGKGERVVFFLRSAAEPSAKYGGLVDPERHAEDSCLPVIYREASALADEDSFVEIDGTRYEIPVLVHIPVFFKGMKGYYSDAMSVGIIRAGSATVIETETPKTFSVGEKWVFERNGLSREYAITARDGNAVVITGKDREVRGVVTGGRLGITEIRAFAPGAEPFRVLFSEPLYAAATPDAEGARKAEGSVTFSIGIDGHDGLVTGTSTWSRDGTARDVTLVPASPDWAERRVLRISERSAGSSVEVRATVGE